MNKRHYEHTLPNIRGSLSNTYQYVKLWNESKKILEKMEQIKEFIAEAIRLPQVWIYMIALVIVGWNLPAVRKGLNKDTDSSNKQKENR